LLPGSLFHYPEVLSFSADPGKSQEKCFDYAKTRFLSYPFQFEIFVTNHQEIQWIIYFTIKLEILQKIMQLTKTKKNHQIGPLGENLTGFHVRHYSELDKAIEIRGYTQIDREQIQEYNTPMPCERNVKEGNRYSKPPVLLHDTLLTISCIPPVLQQEEEDHVTCRMHILESEKPIHQAPG
jgi:hypothetical protein